MGLALQCSSYSYIILIDQVFSQIMKLTKSAWQNLLMFFTWNYQNLSNVTTFFSLKRQLCVLIAVFCFSCCCCSLYDTWGVKWALRYVLPATSTRGNWTVTWLCCWRGSTEHWWRVNRKRMGVLRSWPESSLVSHSSGIEAESWSTCEPMHDLLIDISS